MFIERPSKMPPDGLRSTVAVLHSLGNATAPASDNVAHLESALSRMRLHGAGRQSWGAAPGVPHHHAVVLSATK